MDIKRTILQIIPVQGYEAVFEDSEGELVIPVFVFALVEDIDPDNSTERLVLPMVTDGYGQADTEGEGLGFCDEESNYRGIRPVKPKL
jgi:hypothetical protein